MSTDQEQKSLLEAQRFLDKLLSGYMDSLSGLEDRSDEVVALVPTLSLGACQMLYEIGQLAVISATKSAELHADRILEKIHDGEL